ncbi:maker535 [Drosophila busckii]|uniref:Maker535 n=1 Tax=Drosophila busckii TaxID=30019 RepID=A0A0M3QU14_DROBS|nr:maker535 [Drosophila busckii]
MNTFNFKMTLLNKLTDMFVLGQMYQKSNGYKPWLYKFSVDGCRFLRKPYNILAILTYKLMKDFTNANHTCPYVEAVVFKFTNAVCGSHHPTLVIDTCRIRAINRTMNTFNFKMTLLNKLTDMFVLGQIYQKSNGYKPWLYKFSVDGCRFLRKPYNILAILTYKLMKDFTNANHTCPYVEAVVFKFTNAVCKTSGSTIIIDECRIRAVNRARNTLNFQIKLLEKVTDILYNGQIFKKSNGFKPWLYKVSVDGCRFLDKPFNPVVIIMYRMFKDFSNFNHSCPYIDSITVNGFYLRSEKLRGLPIPTGEYMVNSTFTLNMKALLNLNIYFEFIEDA